MTIKVAQSRLRAGRRVAYDDELPLRMMAHLRCSRADTSVWAAANAVAKRVPSQATRATAMRLAKAYQSVGSTYEAEERMRRQEKGKRGWLTASLLGDYFDFVRLDPEAARNAKALRHLASAASHLADLTEAKPGLSITRSLPEPAGSEAERILDLAHWLLSRREALTAKRGD